jgi:hypothetical protein
LVDFGLNRAGKLQYARTVIAGIQYMTEMELMHTDKEILLILAGNMTGLTNSWTNPNISPSQPSTCQSYSKNRRVP